MKYPAEWKRRKLKINGNLVSDLVTGVLGHLFSRSEPGAKSPKGMITNTVWEAQSACGTSETRDFASMTEAVNWLIASAG